MADPPLAPRPTAKPGQTLTCPVCGASFTNRYPAGECDGCGRIVCGDCLFREVPDHHEQTCRECLERMTPYGGVSISDNRELIAALADPRTKERDRIARLLGDRRVEEALEGLIRALTDRDKYLRSEAATALGKIGDPRAVKPLIAALNDSHPMAQVYAADALALIKQSEAVEPLIKTLDHPHPQAAGTAAQALGKLGDQRAVEPLTRLARRGKEQWPRRRALDALARLSGAASLKTLLDALRDPEPLVRGTACKVLGRLDPAGQVQPLMAILGTDHNRDVRLSAARSLGRLKDFQALEPLIRAMEDRDFRVRREAAMALHGMDWQPSTAEEEILLAFNLGRPPRDRGSVDEVLDITRPFLKDPAPEVRRQAAARTLGELGDPRPEKALREALAHENRVVAREALDALTRLFPERIEKYRAKHLALQLKREKAKKRNQ